MNETVAAAAPPSKGPPGLEQRLEVRTAPMCRAAMHQSWRELLFLHWSFPPDVIQQTLPRGLTVDTFEDRAWLGIVPFFMRDIRPRWSPCIPGISNFQEVNLRTYVYDEKGTPGVWFFSLDANQRLGVWWGRTLYSLPYHAARMRSVCDRSTGRVSFTSQRRGTPASQTCRYDYQPSGAPRSAQPGTLEFFLVERYVLFAGSSQGVNWSVQVAHAPYEISDVDLRHWDEHLIELSGLPLPGRRPDHACVSRGVKVEVFPLMTLARRAELPTS